MGAGWEIFSFVMLKKCQYQDFHSTADTLKDKLDNHELQKAHCPKHLATHSSSYL